MIRINLWFFKAYIEHGTGWAEIDWRWNWKPWVKPKPVTLKDLVEARIKQSEQMIEISKVLSGSGKRYLKF